MNKPTIVILNVKSTDVKLIHMVKIWFELKQQKILKIFMHKTIFKHDDDKKYYAITIRINDKSIRYYFKNKLNVERIYNYVNNQVLKKLFKDIC